MNDEHPDSINDAAFFSPFAGGWADLPASYHNGAGGIAFADGHSEIKRWMDSRTTPPLVAQTTSRQSDMPSPRNLDVAWLQARTTRPKK